MWAFPIIAIASSGIPQVSEPVLLKCQKCAFVNIGVLYYWQPTNLQRVHTRKPLNKWVTNVNGFTGQYFKRCSPNLYHCYYWAFHILLVVGQKNCLRI